MQTRCFIDLETTGLYPETHEIIEVAAIKVLPDGTTQTFYSKVHANKMGLASPKALEINGYNVKDWKNAAMQNEIAARLETFLKNCVLTVFKIKLPCVADASDTPHIFMCRTLRGAYWPCSTTKDGLCPQLRMRSHGNSGWY